MMRAALMLILLCLCAGTARADALDPAKVYGVIVGVLEWKDRELERFPAEHRKDQELYDTLIARGVPRPQLVLLLDRQATLKNIEAAIERVAAQAPPDSTFVFYYEGHGERSDSGEIAFMNYDATASRKRVLSMPRLSRAFERVRAGQVFLFGDACHSGGLEEVARAFATRGSRALSLSSAAADIESTENWTFTQTLIDAFQGDAMVDDNGDGRITVAELANEVTQTMKQRERQRAGYSRHGIDGDLVLVTARKAPTVSLPEGSFAWKDYVLAPDGDGDRPGRIVNGDGDQYVVEFQNYNTRHRKSVPVTRVRKLVYFVPYRFTPLPW